MDAEVCSWRQFPNVRTAATQLLQAWGQHTIASQEADTHTVPLLHLLTFLSTGRPHFIVNAHVREVLVGTNKEIVVACTATITDSVVALVAEFTSALAECANNTPACMVAIQLCTLFLAVSLKEWHMLEELRNQILLAIGPMHTEAERP